MKWLARSHEKDFFNCDFVLLKMQCSLKKTPKDEKKIRNLISPDRQQ